MEPLYTNCALEVKYRPPGILPATLVGVVVIVLGAACASTPEGDERTVRQPVTAVIVNRNPADLRIHAVRDGVRALLGQVVTHETKTFRIPSEFLGGTSTVRLVADPIGSRVEFTTGTIVLEPGETIEWTIHPRPENSRVIVR